MINNNDSIDTTATTIIQEEVLIAVRPRRSSLFKPTAVELKDDDDENDANENREKLLKEYKNWRDLYVDVKGKFLATKNIYSKPTETLHDCSEDFQEFLKKAENYIEKANEFFELINCISAIKESDIILKQQEEFKLELQINTMKENIMNRVNNNEL